MRRAVALAVLGVLLAGCGGSSPAAGALEDTEDKLPGIRSGRLMMLLLASSTTAAEGQGAGFQVEGPFALGVKKGSLPVAGARAFVEVDGRTTELTEAKLADLRVQEEGSGGGLDGLSLGRWLDDPKVAAGPSIDGAATEQITGSADAVAILNDVIGLTERFGAGGEAIKQLEGDAADRVRKAVSGARAEVVTGKDDRLLRRAEVSVDLAVTDPKVREALRELAGARLTLTLAVTEHNQPVEVTIPAGVRR